MLLTTAKDVYLAYTALDFFKSYVLDTSLGKKTLYELCNQKIRDNIAEQQIFINSHSYRFRLTVQKNQNHTLWFAPWIPVNQDTIFKKITDYDNYEILNLLSNQNFILKIAQDQQLDVAVTINTDYSIGGINKIDLYRTHLITLHNFIKKIEVESDISNLLIALATGSGKTFVQALWMLILSISNNNGIFAIPDKLITQFTKDLKRLLPDDLVNKILILRDQEDNPKISIALNNMHENLGTGTIIIGSIERLLTQYYQVLLNTKPDCTFLSFDEQHLIMKTERQRVRLIELSKQKLSMFLTATPNQETYNLSGKKPVAIMSSGQKQNAGQGQFSLLYMQHARNMSDRNKLQNLRFWTQQFWYNIFNGLLLRFFNTIQEEQSSAANALVEELPFYIHRKSGENTTRWGLQVPSARKMLCIIDDNETLVNFCYALQNPDQAKNNIYHDGNIIRRSEISQFFQIIDPETNVIAEDLHHTKKHYKKAFNNDEQKISENLAKKTLAMQLKNTIFHNLIEYVLTDITGLTEIEHNHLRKHDFNQLQNIVMNRFKFRTAHYYQQKLANDLDLLGAQIIGELLEYLSNAIQSMLENDQELRQFIDNWSLSDELIITIQNKYPQFRYKFDDYARSHLMIGMITGMQKAETPIDESKPFSGLEEDINDLYDENGVLHKHAKKRQHTALEILNTHACESIFKPNYLNFSEEIADNYFRLGFVGIYVSNKKTEGFSDINLHTVINITDKRLNLNNSPDTLIQGIGRNRGLDDTIEPAYIHSVGRKQKILFNLKNLQGDDYYPAFFKAEKQFNQEYIAVLGTGVSQKIIDWIYANIQKNDSLNPDRLKRQILKYIAQALRELNNKNSHQIKLSRNQLTAVISYAMKGINTKLTELKNPYTISFGVSILGDMLNFIAECYYSIIKLPSTFKKSVYSWFGVRTALASNLSPRHPDDVYLKILSKTSFKSIIKQMASALELRTWLTRKYQVFIPHGDNNGIESYIDCITPDLHNKLSISLGNYLQNDFLPHLSAFITYPHAQEISKILSRDHNSQQFIHHCLNKIINKELKLTTVEILAEFKNYFKIENFHSLDQELQIFLQELIPLQAELKGNYLSALKGSMKKKLSELVSNKLMPLLASFINNDQKKTQFLAIPHENLFLIKFLNKNSKTFNNLMTNSEADMKLAALALINQLMPQDSPLVLLDIINPQHKATTVANIISKDMKKIALNLWLSAIGEQIAPVLFHKKFIKIIDEVIAFLDEQDLIIIFAALDTPNPTAQAQQIMQFINVIRKKDQNQLMQEFMQISSHDDIDLEQLPLKKMLDDITALMEEVLNCHCYYNQHNNKGQQTNNDAPEILTHISAELRDIRVYAEDDSFISHMTRKVFYLQSLVRGLDDAGTISAESNQHIIKELQRVNTHILRPLWWTTNVSNFSYALIKTSRNIVHAIIDGCFVVLNIIKSLLNKISRNYFTISTKHPDSVDYNNTAFDYAAIINKLEPLNAEQVQQQDCHPDVVINLEEFIAKRQSRPGFFTKKVNQVEDETIILMPALK